MKTHTRRSIRTLLRLTSAITVMVGAVVAPNATAQETRAESAQPRALQEAAATQRSTEQRAIRIFGSEHLHRVEIDGIATADLRIASPVSAVTLVRNVTTPNDPLIHLDLGRTEYKAIKVSGALPPPDDMLDWYRDIRNGNIHRHDGVIYLLANDRSDIHIIKLQDLVPIGLDVEIARSSWAMTLAVEQIQFQD